MFKQFRDTNFYVNEEGLIYNSKRRIIRRGSLSNGYYIAGGYYVHKMVAECFIPNPNNYQQVNHKNEIVNDNRVLNLEWCDCAYNIRYGTGIKRRAKLQTNRHGAKAVLQYTLDGEFVREFPSTMEIIRTYGFRQSHINECCLGKAKSSYGYVWKYKNDGA